MAKGKTNQPLLLEVWVGWHDHAAVKELRAVGHAVRAHGDGAAGCDPDLILHPAAGWHEALFEEVTTESGAKRRPYLEARIRWARARKREGKK